MHSDISKVSHAQPIAYVVYYNHSGTALFRLHLNLPKFPARSAHFVNFHFILSKRHCCTMFTLQLYIWTSSATFWFHAMLIVLIPDKLHKVYCCCWIWWSCKAAYSTSTYTEWTIFVTITIEIKFGYECFLAQILHEWFRQAISCTRRSRVQEWRLSASRVQDWAERARVTKLDFFSDS